MTITFAGIVIGQDLTDGGTDGVEGFFPSGKQNVQIQEFLRATDATPVARGNRIHTLKGTISPAPFASSSAALMSLLQRFAGLPQSGALSFAEGGEETIFPLAVLAGLESTRDGCSYSVDLTFQTSAPSAAQAQSQAFHTDAGAPVVTDAGITVSLNPGP